MWQTADNLIYAAGRDLYNTFRLHFTMTEPVNGGALEQAAQETARRFPYFCFRVVINGGEYRFEDNPLPIAVTKGSRAVTLGSAESNHHLLALAYEDNSLYFDVSHCITDGQGSFPFIQTLLHRYLSLVHPEAEFDTERLFAPPGSVPSGEEFSDPYPEKPLDCEPLGRLDRPAEVFLLPGQTQGYDGMSGWRAFSLTVRQNDLMGYVSGIDGSPSSFIASLIYRAADDLHPENELPVVCGMQHSFRGALGKKFSRHCHVNIAPIVYTRRMHGRDLERLNTMTRGSVILRTDFANDAQTADRHILNSERMKQMTLEQKRKYMRRELLDGIGLNTFEVSYTGRVPWCGLDRYIESVSPYLDMTLSGGISAEIFAVGENFCVTFMQRSGETEYVRRISDILSEQHIPHTLAEPRSFQISPVSLPENMTGEIRISSPIFAFKRAGRK